MSTSPPDFQSIVRCFQIEKKRFDADLERLASTEDETWRGFVAGLTSASGYAKRMEKVLSIAENSKLSQAEVIKLSNDATRSVQQLQRLFRERLDKLGEDGKICIFQAHHFEEHTKYFSHALKHREAINAGQFESLLDQRWAQEEFCLLVEGKNFWAIEKLEQYLKESGPYAAIARHALLYFADAPHLMHAYIDQPWLHDGLAEMIDLNSPSRVRNRACDLISDLMSFKPCPWAEEIFKKHLQNPSDKVVLLLNTVFLMTNAQNPWLETLIIDGFIKNHDWILCLICDLIEDYDSECVFQLTEKIFKAAQNRPPLQQALMAIGVIMEESFFSLTLQTKIKEGYFQNPIYSSKEQVKVFNRLLQHQSCMRFADSNDLNWNELKLEFCLETLRRILRREERLKKVLLNPEKESPKYKKPAISDYFPKTNRLLVGHATLGQPKIFQPAVKDLADFLIPYGIDVVFFGPTKELEGMPEKAHMVEEYLDADIWVRDACIMHISGMRIPKIVHIQQQEEILRNLLEARQQRMRQQGYSEEKIPVNNTLGGVAKGYNQIKIAYNFSRLPHGMDPYHDMYFTYQELGNGLIGSSAEGPYAILGKDTLEFNRNNLALELAELGWRKVGRQFVLGDPYPVSECLLTDDDLRFFFALDLGIESDQIYFVENIDFHIDIGMAVLMEKKY